MAKWQSFGRSMKKIPKPKKSIAELEAEIEALRKAKESVRSYNELEAERNRLKSEVRQEGMKLRHRKAFNIINKAQSLAKNTYTASTSPRAKKTYKKTYNALKKAKKQLDKM